MTPEWLEALRRGKKPMVATVTVVVGCLGVWIASLATGGLVWSGTVHGRLDHDLARNAILINEGQWWRALSYGTLNLSVYAFVYVMALFFLAGLQVERTYGTGRFLTILLPSWTAGALAGLLVEPAHALNAGTSGATFGVMAAAAIDLLRRRVAWYRTFWLPTMAIILVLGFIFPGSVTWGPHVGGIVAGGIVGALICDPRHPDDRRRLTVGVVVAVLLVVATLLAVPGVAAHSVDHGPVLIGAPPP